MNAGKYKYMKHFYIFLVVVLFLFYAQAEIPPISIGQIQASGVTADDEFIEILNTGGTDIAIGEWSIQYKSASGTKYYKKNFASGAIIPANGHYIIAGSGYAGAYDLKQSTISLAAGGGTVYVVANQITIENDTDSDIVAQKTYSATDAPPANTNQNTNTNSNTNVNAGETENTNTTSPPVAKNTVPVSVLPIKINEVMPNPSDTAEWVELYDADDYAVDLAGWHLADGTGKNIATLSGLIFPRGFMRVELSVARLNNIGDLVILRDDKNREADSVAYGDWESNENNPPAPDENYSLARRADGLDTNSDFNDFAVTQTPTPALANIIAPMDGQSQMANSKVAATATKPTTKIDTKWLVDLFKTQSDEISKLLKADNVIIINNLYIGADATAKTITATTSSTTKSATIKTSQTATAKTVATSSPSTPKTTTTKSATSVSGTVIFPPNVIAKDVFVVKETNRSVEVRLALNSKLSPAVGDVVTAYGSWSTAKSLPMPKLLVKTDSAMTIKSGTAPAIKKIEIKDAENNLNLVVAVTGVIAEKTASKLRIADSDNSILIKTIFEAAKGERLSAKGLLVKQGSDNVLIPATTSDLAIIKSPEESKTPTLARRASLVAIAVGPPLLLLGAVIIGKRFKKKGGDANA